MYKQIVFAICFIIYQQYEIAQLLSYTLFQQYEIEQLQNEIYYYKTNYYSQQITILLIIIAIGLYIPLFMVARKIQTIKKRIETLTKQNEHLLSIKKLSGSSRNASGQTCSQNDN